MNSTSALAEDWTAVKWGAMFARCGGLQSDQTPVVLVHGLVVSSSYMVPTAEILAGLCPVYAIDLPGFGRSCKPRRTLSFAEHAEALEQWLSAKGLAHVHLVGNSMGCQIIAEYATRYTGRIGRIVFAGPTVDRHARSFWPQVWRQMKDLPLERSGLIPIIIKDYVAAGMRRALVTVREVLRDRIEVKLPLLEKPVLVVTGAKDPICPADWVTEVVRLLPRGELRVLEGARHAVNYSNAEDFVAAMRPFLRL